MPGSYSVRVTIPGIKAPLTGKLTVDADPLPRFAATDRATRQALLMQVYAWTRTLGEAVGAVRTLTAQRESLKSDLGERADSLNARVTRLSGDVGRAFNTVNGQRAPIEGWSGLPSVDQRKSLEFALDDARAATAELNRLVSTDIPAAYRTAGKTWSRPVPRVQQPAGGGGAMR
jgi:hypothetical protein